MDNTAASSALSALQINKDLTGFKNLRGLTISGEGGIRTPGAVAHTPHFECGPFDLSGTSPVFFKNKIPPRGTYSAEREGFEPPDLLQSTVFKTAAFDRSAISPRQK